MKKRKAWILYHSDTGVSITVIGSKQRAIDVILDIAPSKYGWSDNWSDYEEDIENGSLSFEQTTVYE